MTFGIDVSGFQAGMDMVRAKADGTEFVIVKAVAAFKPEHTIADGYHAHIDNAILADLPRGHYLVPNSRNTPEQSAEFMAANLYQYTPGDVLALDNEPLDSYATWWDDGECARFFRRLHELTGHPYQRMWWYCPANQTRNNRPWWETEALGVVPWWVAYGDYPTGRTPDHEPALDGSIGWWGVHQFTSKSRVAGRDVDGNFSPRTVDDLFGGGGMTAGYSNVNNFIVILADDRDPWVSWANHLARGSAGGVDVVAPVGTPLYAPADCVIANSPWNGTAGHTVTLSFADGWRDQMMHLSEFATPGVKRKGEYIGKSGATASGKTNGVDPHVHWHRIDPYGRRQNPWNYFTGTGLAGGGYTPIEEFLMALSDAEQAELLKNIRDVRNAIFYGGNSMKDGGRSISESLADLAAGRRPVVKRDTDGDGVLDTVSALQDNADTNTMVRKLVAGGAAEVDAAAVAELVKAAVIPAVLAAVEGSGSGVTVEQVGEAAETALRNVFRDISG